MIFSGKVNTVNFFVNKKRGSLSDLIYIMVIFVVVGITIVIGKTIFLQINDAGFMEDYSFSRNIMNNAEDRLLPLFDVIFLGVLIAGFLGTLFLAYMLRTSPLFFWIGVLFLVIVVMLSAVFSNVYQEVAGVTQFSEATASDVTFMNTTMNNLPLIMAIIGSVVLIVLYGLSRYQEGAI